MSQWNPAGFRSGNSVPWAIKDDTGKWVLAYALRDLSPTFQALTIMIEVEQNGEQNCERDSKEDISNTDIPEPNQPRTVEGWEESLAGRKCSNINIPHLADVNKPSKKNDGQGCTVIFEELSNKTFEEVTVPQFTTNPRTHQDKKRNHDAQIGRRLSYRAPLSGENLNALLQVDASNIEPKNVARESRDIGKSVTGIGDG